MDRTSPFSTVDLDALRGLQRRERAPTRVSLLFHHRHGVDVVPLAEGQSLIVGRSHPADLVLVDESLSRQHASFDLIDGKLWVEDLGSTNGTRVDGVEVTRAEVALDADLLLGAVTVTAHALGADETVGEGLVSHDRFLRALDAELSRSRDYRRPLSLMLIRGRRDRAGPVARWWPTIRASTRPYDQAALYSDDTIELFLPERGLTESKSFAKKLLEGAPHLFCGIGVFPEHATSVEALLESSRESLQRTTVERRVVTSASSPVSHARDGDGEPVVRSEQMIRVFENAREFADMSMPVLIQGETGTGKEVVARLIHESSSRAGKSMVVVNCGAIPEQLIESTLFGHERGAFTGAQQQQKGVFESAHGSTVFLDEIGELSLKSQAALLRVLETRRFSRVGSTKEIEVDVHVIAATHRDLAGMSARGDFREDLFYRLDAIAIFVPPLRDRPDDLEPLVERFIARSNAANGRSVEGLSDQALELVRRYHWPGNVRELRNAIERAVVVARGSLIEPDDLPRRVAQIARDARQHATRLPPTPAGTIDLKAEVQRYEAELIRKAIAETKDRTRAANNLGIAVRTLFHKMKLYGITG